ncbi:hypothetical protein JQC91_06515 [Jannaschia sp. Os4]|uniref:hypothetical protein n=1 Tax=Jannaschia sp. Os4 TaxID=2807617 RepID=UPI00193A575A|nr:hypothetical protein [Jannaschia sp. Os4]MBM2575951.1 hypothetical protein [Jannaschia sp. Os4]
MTTSIVLDPLLPLWLVIGLAALAAAIVVLTLWRRSPGWWLRLGSLAVLLAALLNPSLQSEEREALSDILLAVVDRSASQTLSDRTEQTDAALAALEAEAEDAGLDLRVTTVRDDPTGTLAMAALSELLAEVPRDRVAGAVIVSDGRVADAGLAPDLPAPLHLLRTGRTGDWDRRLVVSNAPAFAILDEEFTITLEVEDQGAAPGDLTTPITVSVDGGEPQTYEMPIGRPLDLPLALPHGGRNVIEFTIPEAEGELTARNNAAVVQINGVRDRLRVLLVSGEPHPGQRTWRNLLKADSAVDLVHFTILRPPGKQDGVPVTELSLIAFPTRELFIDKIDEFDLIIFDRYQRRGILPGIYLDNVRRYVEDGGAVLIAAGPDFATADSLYRSPLAPVLPGSPSSILLEGPFQPQVSETGDRHPVTSGLDLQQPEDEWGRWFRQVQVKPSPTAQEVMTGYEDEPLLLLDRVGPVPEAQGRVALLASDHAWLWDRGFEGGGPQAELLRRVAHWLMKEPDLEEEALLATALGQEITVVRRTLGDAPGAVTVTAPDGMESVLALSETGPGQFSATVDADQQGLWRFEEGERTTVIGLGPPAPAEFVETVATDAVLADAVATRRGGAIALEAGAPDLRPVAEGRAAAGRGWIGYVPREAYLLADLRLTPLAPAWVMLLLAALLAVGAWLREGRRT